METVAAPDSNPDANAALVNAFCEITSSSKQEALFYLESHNFDLDAAVSTFLDSSVSNAVATADNVTYPIRDTPSPPEFSPSMSPSRSRSASPNPSRAAYELRSRRNRGKTEKKPSGSRSGGIRTLADLKQPAQEGSDSDSDDEPQEYYTGGEKSGMLVQDPTKGHSVDDIFSKARERAVDGSPESSKKSSTSKSFTGTARLLSGETVPSAPQPSQPPESVTHTVTFWRNGFSVDDGPLRQLEDPQNAPFIESITRSECPRELQPADPRTTVHVNLTRRDEDYPEPAKPRHRAFHGVGRTLGSSSSGTEAAGEPNETAGVAAPTNAPLPSMGLIVSDSVTSIQLRLADGTRMVSRFNHHHTIRDIRAFIDASRPGGVRSYQLQTVGFPPKQLADLDQTIEQAGIANSVVIQRV
ncbi:hypothetical protein L6164_029115 [Bauhinia variegata]|uniref:Uncharacterized protein n=1 Tax=Bauhinia variegata TaxID=167791 RepID=A0ACB9L8H2_BAUVA|nr:hypothetical protein L6164_029115 [Bauhinia variegata]